MKVDAYSFNRGAVRPMVCLREAWQIIKPDYWLFLGIIIVGVLLGSMFALVLMGPVMCGVHYCLFRQERGRMVTFNMLFKGFEYFVPSLIATLLMTLPMMVFVLGAYMVFVGGIFGTIATLPEQPRGAPPDPAFFVVLMSLSGLYVFSIFAITITFQALFFFVYPLIVDRKLSGVEAVKLSIRAFFGNFWGVIGVMLLIQLLSMTGVLFCYVGAFLVLPITFAMVSTAYGQVFGDDEQDDIDEETETPTLVFPVTGPTETGIQSRENATDVAPGEPQNPPGT